MISLFQDEHPLSVLIPMSLPEITETFKHTQMHTHVYK